MPSEKALKNRMREENGSSLIRKLRMEYSHSNNLIQLADMICGAVAREYNGDLSAGAAGFRRIIKPKEVRVQFWPR